MSRRSLILFVALTVACVGGWKAYKAATAGEDMTASAEKFIASLDAEQKKQAVLEYDTPKRVAWHFIPLAERKGVQIKHMTQPQRDAAHALLKASLSQTGYSKATKIMSLENLLLALERGRGPLRDPERYYFTIFGTPTADGKWGLSVEGHHLSLNFVVEKNKIIASTPAAFATNPAEVKAEVAGIAAGTRILNLEETIAFELVNSLSDEQRKVAIIAEKDPGEVRDPGKPQPPLDKPAGIAAKALKAEQKKLLRQLVEVYLKNHPQQVVDTRLSEIEAAGWDNLHFCWAGGTKLVEGHEGHYYRIQGPTFLVEFVNHQPDAAGNKVNHIHSLWRDVRGDFAIPVAKN
jgi:hypothetical protein